MGGSVKKRNTNISIPKASKVQVQYSIYVLIQTTHTILHTCWCTVIMQGHGTSWTVLDTTQTGG